MKVLVEENVECYINGVKYVVQKGVQELEDFIAELLINVGKAEPLAMAERENEDDKRRRG